MQLPMTKVQVISTYRQLEPVLAALQRLGVVQLEDAVASSGGLARLPRDQATENQRETLNFLLVRLDAVLTVLPARSLLKGDIEYEVHAGRPFDILVSDIRASLNAVVDEVQTLVRRREELAAERQSLPRYEATIRRLLPLAAEIPQLDRFETVALLIDRHFNYVLETLHDELAALTDQQLEIVSDLVDEQTVGAILVFPRQYSATIHNLLGQEHISQVRLPDELAGVPFHSALTTLQARLDAIPAELAQVEDRLADLSKTWYARLVTWRSVVRDRLTALNARGFLAATEHTFVITGWVPRRAVASIQQVLREEVGEEVIVTELALTPEEQRNAPVVLANPAAVRPFETLVRLLALPRYNTFDPSLLVTIFMPLFFGMILGDIAYGLAVLGLAIWMRRRFTGTLHDLGSVFLLSGGWAVIFGFLYGEFLGSAGEAFGLHPLFNRAEAIVPLFATAIAMGIVQILLGLVLGLWVALRQRHLGHVSEKVGTLIGLIGLFAMIAVVADLLPAHFFTPMLVLMLIGVILLSVPMGLIGVLLGPLEFLGVVGNLLSYLRIAAIGLSSVYLAEVANEMAGLAGNVILGVIVAGLFHVLNLALGIISPTIQALRLQYVEFFGKFFEAGGTSFQPFKREDWVG